MKLKIFSLILVVAMVMGAFVSPVKAAAYGTSFLTSITYMNVGTGEASITVDFYNQGASTITKTYTVANLAAGAAASLSVGSVFQTGFTGSAIMSSNQPLVATMVQVAPSGSTVKNRPMSNGFSSGSTTALLPTVLKGTFNTNSIFSVQNAGSATANVDVKFVPKDASSGTAFTDTVSLAPGAAKYFDMGVYTNAGTTFNGSVSISSVQPIVASSIEEHTDNDAAYAFEAIASGATTLYMPSAMCKYGAQSQTSYYAVQNSSSSDSTVSVRFVGKAGTTAVDKTISMGTIGAGAKVSVPGCGPTGTDIQATFIGSAVVTGTQPVVAIAKVQGAGNFQTAHYGLATGASKLAAPYVRFSQKFYSYTNQTPVQQAYIAVQNIGTADIPAGQVKVSFVDATGAEKGSITNSAVLAAGAKFSVSPKDAGLPEFGYTTGTTGLPTAYGGGALITGPSGSSLASVVRVQTNTSAGDVAEDYNATPVQ